MDDQLLPVIGMLFQVDVGEPGLFHHIHDLLGELLVDLVEAR